MLNLEFNLIKIIKKPYTKLKFGPKLLIFKKLETKCLFVKLKWEPTLQMKYNTRNKILS